MKKGEDGSPPQCWLKSSLGASTSDPYVVSGAPNGPAPPPPPPGAPTPQPPAPAPKPSCSSGVVKGVMKYKDGGVDKWAYVLNMNNGLSMRGEDGFNLPQSANRAYIAKAEGCPGGMAPDIFLWPQLRGRTLSYTMDLGGMSCGCCAAVYMVAMPAGSATQCGDYYCDAPGICGAQCEEMDIQEANTHGFVSTPHASGDGSGCGTHPPFGWDYGRPFRVSISFNANAAGGAATNATRAFSLHPEFSMYITISQDGEQKGGYGVCGNQGAIGNKVDQMVLVISNWAGGTDFIDGGNCGGCNGASLTFSDLEIS